MTVSPSQFLKPLFPSKNGSGNVFFTNTSSVAFRVMNIDHRERKSHLLRIARNFLHPSVNHRCLFEVIFSDFGEAGLLFGVLGGDPTSEDARSEFFMPELRFSSSLVFSRRFLAPGEPHAVFFQPLTT